MTADCSDASFAPRASTSFSGFVHNPFNRSPAAFSAMALLAFLSAALGLALAADPVPTHPLPDQERARAAVAAGEILPLGEILERRRSKLAGRILEVELEREDGRWVYEIEVLQADGRKCEVEIDAATARVLEVETDDDDDDVEDD